jgi:simple sugar transport system ATP-binding protein
MYRGKIVAIVPSEEATKEFIGLLMAGVPEAQARAGGGQEHTPGGGRTASADGGLA